MDIFSDDLYAQVNNADIPAAGAPARVVSPTVDAPARIGRIYDGRQNGMTTGVDIQGCRNAAEAYKKADLAWDPVLVPLQTPDGFEVPGVRGVVRNDTKHPLPASVTPRYKPVPHRPLMNAAARLVGETANTDHAIRPLSAGHWDNGGRVWMEFRMGEDRKVSESNVGDRVRARITIIADHRGTGSSIARLNGWETRCRNGMTVMHTAALARITHMGDIDAQFARFREIVANMAQGWDHAVRLHRTLNSAPTGGIVIPPALRQGRRTDGQLGRRELVRAYVAAVFGRDEIEAQIENQGHTRRADAIVHAYENAPGSRADLGGGEHTARDLLSALTYHVTHGRKMTSTRHASMVAGDARRTMARGTAVAYALGVEGIPLDAVLEPDSPALRQVEQTLAAGGGSLTSAL